METYTAYALDSNFNSEIVTMNNTAIVFKVSELDSTLNVSTAVVSGRYEVYEVAFTSEGDGGGNTSGMQFWS